MAVIDLSKIQKILVISTTHIGDTVLTTPTISLLREHFPLSHISVMIGPNVAPLFQGSRMVDEVFAYNKKVSWFKRLKFVLELKKRKFDLVVDLRNTAIPIFIQPRYRNSLFLDRSSVPMRQKHLNQLRFLFPVDDPGENKFDFFTPEEQTRALEKLPIANRSHFMIIAPGAGSDLKRWTISGFIEVTNYFLEKGMTIVLIGWERETELGLELVRKASKPIVNLIGDLTLRESAGLISRASLVIANDSAVMHLAHELDRPTVSIFGPTDEKKYGQEGTNRQTVRLNLDCTPCEVAQCRLERRICLDDLPATSVIQACETLLNHATH